MRILSLHGIWIFVQKRKLFSDSSDPQDSVNEMRGFFLPLPPYELLWSTFFPPHTPSMDPRTVVLFPFHLVGSVFLAWSEPPGSPHENPFFSPLLSKGHLLWTPWNFFHWQPPPPSTSLVPFWDLDLIFFFGVQFFLPNPLFPLTTAPTRQL